MSAERSLHDLLLNMFTPDEFVAFTHLVLMEEGLAHGLPSTSVNATTFFFDVIQVLRHRGMIDRDLFDALLKKVKANSNMAAKIGDVARTFGIELSSRNVAAPPPPATTNDAALTMVDVFQALTRMERQLFNLIVIDFDPPAEFINPSQDVADRALGFTRYAASKGQLTRLVQLIRSHAPGALPRS